MKRIGIIFLVFCMMLGLSSCGSGKASSETGNPQEQTAAAQQAENPKGDEETDIAQNTDLDETVGQDSQEETEKNDMPKTDNRILIAYFSRADENYSVGVIEKGNTEIIAEMIAEETGGELFQY